MGPPLPPERKTIPTWLWVVIGIFAFLFVSVAAVTMAGIYFVKKFAENPRATIEKFVEHNPNIEIVSADDGSGKMTLRDKHSGKKFTIDYEDAKSGRIHFQADGKEFTLKTNSHGIEVRDGDRTTRVGGGAGRIPAWVPVYPGSQPEVTVSEESASESSGTLAFKTKDSEAAVEKYYEDALKSAGYSVSPVDEAGRESRALEARSASGNRTVKVTAKAGFTGTHVAIEFREQTR